MAVQAIPLYLPTQAMDDPVHTDEDFEKRRREARAKLAEAMKQRPIQHWTQGLHQMSEAALAGYDDYKARQDAKAYKQDMADIMGRMWPGGGSVGGSTGPTIPKSAMSAPPPPAPPTNTGPIPQDIKSQFGGSQPAGGQGIPMDAAYSNPPNYPAQPAPPEAAAPSSATLATGHDDGGLGQAGFDAYDAYMAQQSAPPPPPAAPQPREQQAAMPTQPNPLSNFNDAGLYTKGQPPFSPMPPPPPSPIQQRMVPTQAINPMSPAPEASPNDMAIAAPPPDLSARVMSPGMMAPPPPKGMMGLGAATLPPVEGTMIQPPAAAAPAAAQPSPFNIRDLTGGLTRGPGGERDPSGIRRIVAHDVTGNIAPENLAKYSQTNKGYHYAVDRNSGEVYQLQNPKALAYHTKGANADSLGVAMTGNEGEPVSDAAKANMAQLLQKLQADYKLGPEAIATHPSMQQGKNPKEADWLPAALAYKAQAADAPVQTVQAPAQPDAKPSGLIQMAQQGGGMTPELFKALALRDPKMAQHMLMQEMQRSQNAPDRELDREKTRSEINKNNAQANSLGGKADYGTTPPGYHRFTDPQGRTRMEMVPGAPADEKTVLRMQGDERTMSYTQQTLNELQLAAKELRDHPGLGGNTGIKGVFPNMPGGDAANAKAKLDTLRSKVGFSTLQTMRDASKSGGALGSVTEGEHKLLQNTLDSLDKAQSYDEFQKSLDNIVRQTEESKSRIKYHFDRAYGGRANEQAHPSDPRTKYNGQGYAQPSGGDPWSGGFPGTQLPKGWGVQRVSP